MSGGAPFDLCAWVLEQVANGSIAAALAIVEWPKCGPVMDSSGVFWFPDGWLP